MKLKEGGNAIPESIPVPKKYIPSVIKSAISKLPPELQQHVQTDIGSAGFKQASGDLDVFIDAQEVVNFFGANDEKVAKQKLKQYFEKTGSPAVVAGRNVHIGVQFPGGIAQVDFMVIADSAIVAPWHQHGPRGSYNDPDFKGAQIFILLNSIGKPLGLKFDAFGAKLMRRDTNEVVARDRDSVAKLLLNPSATGDDLNSVKTIMTALQSDPQKDIKLAQARADAQKGLITLPESVQPGTGSWFRSLQNIVIGNRRIVESEFLGTCANSFDEDGECVVPGLYNDVSDFAVHEEEAVEISLDEFTTAVGNISPAVRGELGNDLAYLYDTDNEIYMIYDQDADVHYFFKGTQ